MRRAKRMSILVLAGCMASVALVSAFAGYGVATRAAAGADGVTLHGEDAEPVADNPIEAAPGAEPVAALAEGAEQTAATASPEVRVIEPPPETSDTIAIPGFKRLTVEGQTLHAGAITNPEQNACYFIVTVIMPGGAELYRSTYLAPGQSLGDVETLVPLSPKTYEGVTAKYTCYTLDELKPLNGADITFTLEVLP
jgi:hypothetical protein